jgi:hypothetical protein
VLIGFWARRWPSRSFEHCLAATAWLCSLKPGAHIIHIKDTSSPISLSTGTIVESRARLFAKHNLFSCRQHGGHPESLGINGTRDGIPAELDAVAVREIAAYACTHV